MQINPRLAKSSLKAAIGHHRTNNRVVGKRSAFLHGKGKTAQNLITINDLAGLISHDQPIGITIKTNPRIGTMRHHSCCHRLRMNRTAIFINIETVRRYRQWHNFGTKFIKRIRRGAIGSAIRTINNQL